MRRSNMIKTEDGLNRNGTQMRGKIILSDDVSIKMICERKMCFETSLQINTNSICRVELIDNDNEKMKLTGETLSSLLKRVQADNGDHVPIYEVCMKFIELNDIEKQFLDNLKNQHESQNCINMDEIVTS
jgi:hypothetical protein